MPVNSIPTRATDVTYLHFLAILITLGSFSLIKNIFINSNYLFSEYPYKFTKVLKSQQAIEKDTITLLCELDDAAGDVKW